MAAINLKFRDNDRGLLRVASELAQAAGKSAAKACEHAECTVGQSEAQELEGYSEENLMRIEKMVAGLLEEVPTKARMALATGLRLYAQEVDKLEKKAGTLILDTDSQEKRENIARCLRVVVQNEMPELALELDDQNVIQDSYLKRDRMKRVSDLDTLTERIDKSMERRVELDERRAREQADQIERSADSVRAAFGDAVPGSGEQWEPYRPDDGTTVSINGGPHVPLDHVQEALAVVKGEKTEAQALAAIEKKDRQRKAKKAAPAPTGLISRPRQKR